MPLNYSKWDQLEVSDDSDIEGHPNVDKRSLIRWKQRDIHEKRELRNQRIAAYRAEIACNKVLAPRLDRIHDRFKGLPVPQAEGQSDASHTQWAEDFEDARRLTGLPFFQHLVERLLTSPSPAAPPTNSKDQPTYDGMILSLLQQIHDSTESLPSDEQEKSIMEGLERHITQLGEHTSKLERDLDSELLEKSKHITSDDIKEGFENKYVPPKPSPPPIPNAITKPSEKKETTTYEVLNPRDPVTASPPEGAAGAEDDQDDLAELPKLPPVLAEFSRLPLWDYSSSFSFIQKSREVVVPGASDALLVAAFNALSSGDHSYAKQCIHQSQLLQFCDRLGKDGVRLFFQKMIAGDKRAKDVFVKDVEDMYAHIAERAKAVAPSQSVPKEHIQLVSKDPAVELSFNVPEGPPPDDLQMEGPGMEDYDPDKVRKALTMRWQVFQAFPKPLQDALRTRTLQAVNDVLADMEIPEAEDVVSKLDMVGILNLAEGGIRDETGIPRVEEEASDDAA